MRPFALCLLSFVLLAAPLPAQFSQRTMATDMTGSELLFATEWALQGETYNPHSKIIRYRGGRLETYQSVLAERDPATGHLTNLPAVILPEMSLDGQRYAFTMDCPKGETCTSTNRNNTEVRNERGELVYAGSGSFALSANGLWARNGSDTLVSLENGQSERLWPWSFVTPGVPLKGRQVANDGTIVIGLRSRLVFVKRPGIEAEFVELSHNFDTATVADSGNFAVVQTLTTPLGPKPGLWLFDLNSKTAIPMAIANEGCHSPSLSTDGSKVVFLSGANWLTTNASHITQAFMMDLATGALTQLTQGVSPAIEALITGDGRSTFVRLDDGAICQVDNQTGERTEVNPTTPQAMEVFGAVVPGSRRHMWIKGEVAPRLTIDGIDAKVLQVGGGILTFIAPEGIASGDKDLEVSYEGTPFQSYRIPIKVTDLQPAALYWNIIPMIWHDTDGTAVWEAHPARAGEIIEVLMTGLGPTDENGNTLLPMNWRFWPPYQQEPGPIVEVLASRKSPYEGEEGLYRVKLRVPQISDAGTGTLSCFDARDESISNGFPLAVKL